MRVSPIVFPDPEALGRRLAAEIADEIETAARARRMYVLGCPGVAAPPLPTVRWRKRCWPAGSTSVMW